MPSSTQRRTDFSPVQRSDGRGVSCWPADPNGFADVATAIQGMSDRVPMVLAHDLNGQQAQALTQALETVECTAQLFFAAVCLPSPADTDDVAMLAAFAMRQWGARIVQRAREATMLGWTLRARRGNRMVPCAPLGLRIAVTPALVHSQDYHAVAFEFSASEHIA